MGGFSRHGHEPADPIESAGQRYASATANEIRCARLVRSIRIEHRRTLLPSAFDRRARLCPLFSGSAGRKPAKSDILLWQKHQRNTAEATGSIHSEKNKAMRTKRRDRLSPVPLSCSGAKSGTRTHDLFVTNEMLYRLSYFGNVRILAELRVQIWEKFPEFPAKTFIFFRRATYEVHISLIISHINNSMQAMTDDPKKQRPKHRQPFLGSERTSPAMPYEKDSSYKGCPSKPSRPRTAFAATRQEGSATARARRS